MTTAEAKARQMISRRSTEKLVEDYETLDRQISAAGHMTHEQAMVNCWICDELEKRNQEAYDAWVDDEDWSCSPRKYYL